MLCAVHPHNPSRTVKDHPRNGVCLTSKALSLGRCWLGMLSAGELGRRQLQPWVWAQISTELHSSKSCSHLTGAAWVGWKCLSALGSTDLVPLARGKLQLSSGSRNPFCFPGPAVLLPALGCVMLIWWNSCWAARGKAEKWPLKGEGVEVPL